MTYNPQEKIMTQQFPGIRPEPVEGVYVTVVDPVKEPAHYKFPGGVQVIDITQHLNFCLGNVVKYVCRAGRKSSNKLQDLEKAQTYLEIEIARVRAEQDKALEEQNARMRNMGRRRLVGQQLMSWLDWVGTFFLLVIGVGAFWHSHLDRKRNRKDQS